jgi:hypothetical protein
VPSAWANVSGGFAGFNGDEPEQSAASLLMAEQWRFCAEHWQELPKAAIF